MGRPLDKKEAVLYGQFVHAAYNMFKRDPTQLRPQPATGDIPDPYELVAWLNMSDYFFWWREKPKFYGFIAWHREQKHNFVLAIRGTEGVVEWLDDFMARLVRFREVPNTGRVENGYAGIYSTLKVVNRSGPPTGRLSPRPLPHRHRRPRKSRKPSASNWRTSLTAWKSLPCRNRFERLRDGRQGGRLS